MPKTKRRKSAAERQAEFQARLRELTPLEKAFRIWQKRNCPSATVTEPYTAEEQALVDQIRQHQGRLQDLTSRLNQRLLTRYKEHQDAELGKAVIAELEGTYTRLQIPAF